MRRALDFILDRHLKRPAADLDPALRCVLEMSAYQILYLSRIPTRAAIHEGVELARKVGHEGTAKLANAVLRRVAQAELDAVPWPVEPLGRIATRHSYPDWLVARWAAEYGLEEAEALAAAQNRPLPLCLRVNMLKTSRDAVLARFAAAGVAADPSPIAVEGVRLREGGPPVARLPGYNEGWWYVQGEAAMLAATALDPQPGETIADIGAAPGGKTTHLAERMRNSGRILAIEPHAGRLALVVENARRLGITCITPLERSAEEPLGEVVDRALVDAPCSGLGTLYRKADLRWRMTAAEADKLPELQLRLLETAGRAVKAGGALLYATCTTLRAENRDVAEAFLARNPGFKRGDLVAAGWREEARGGMMQFLPHRHGTEGFFLARFDKC